MNLNEVIKYPVLSEKTYNQMAEGTYTFAVDFRTNKAEVKKVVEYIFDVKVARVNIQTVQKKSKRVGQYEGSTKRYKKAIVTLVAGNVINIFPDEAEASAPAKETKANVESKKEETKEMSEAEKKAAAKIEAKAKEKEVKAEEAKTKAPAKEEKAEEAK